MRVWLSLHNAALILSGDNHFNGAGYSRMVAKTIGPIQTLVVKAKGLLRHWHFAGVGPPVAVRARTTGWRSLLFMRWNYGDSALNSQAMLQEVRRQLSKLSP